MYAADYSTTPMAQEACEDAAMMLEKYASGCRHRYAGGVDALGDAAFHGDEEADAL